MKTIVAALTASGLALSLAACGTNIANNGAAADEAAVNDTIVTDEVPVDANLIATGNGGDLSPVDPPVEENTSVANTL
ncbi:MAG: hypothetical protein PGN23_03105 [Sphingomonas adhaesiva]|uniref:hypothetical protein n=1 Tax=Sphingomonas adhaesiva TaxID=28212 RepID=UPI002FFA6B23